LVNNCIFWCHVVRCSIIPTFPLLPAKVCSSSPCSCPSTRIGSSFSFDLLVPASAVLQCISLPPHFSAPRRYRWAWRMPGARQEDVDKFVTDRLLRSQAVQMGMENALGARQEDVNKLVMGQNRRIQSHSLPRLMPQPLCKRRSRAVGAIHLVK
jgi:hypothetical protein